MDVLETLSIDRWDAPVAPEITDSAINAVESGKVLYLPNLAFHLNDSERRFLTPSCTDGSAKNISFDSRTGALKGTCLAGADRAELVSLVARFSRQASELVALLLPRYALHLQTGLTSYRPVEVEGRPSSYKKDDTRLHVDAFASRPNRGRRILRVFSNVNPAGIPRVWNLGEPFEPFAMRFAPRVGPPLPGSAWLLERLNVTKGPRSRYDHLMLGLHDRAKEDMDYQRSAPKVRMDFPPGSTWVVFTDQVLHAALSGQYLLEQTFYLPVRGMKHEERSPLRVLERLAGRPLA